MDSAVRFRAPRPLLVQYAGRDELFPPEGMRRAHEAISRRYPDGGYEGVCHDVPHAFTAAMQEQAFTWLADRLTP